MIDVAYTLTPIKINLDFVGLASRMLTENLLRNKNINPEFSNACLFTSIWNVDNWNELAPEGALRYASGLEHTIFTVDCMPSEKYAKIITNIKSEYVLISVFHLMDLIAVKHLLNDDRKVVIGGTTAILFEPKFIRSILTRMGAKNVDTHLIIINGNVDLSTDLYPMIMKWEDTKILTNDHQTLWDCKNDYLQRLRKLRKAIKGDGKIIQWWDNYEFVSFALNLKCFWGKCKFCSYRKLPICDYRDDPDRILNSIHETMEMYDCNILRFVDSYFEFNDLSLTLLDNLKERYNIEAIFLGVLALSKPENVIKASKYIKYFFIGMESFSPYSLKAINKGYTLEHINKMIDNFIRYLDRDAFIHMFMIGDLPNKTVEDVKRAYGDAMEAKNKLHRAGFGNVRFTFQPLSLNPIVELKEGLVLGDNSVPSGQQKLIQHLKSKGVKFFETIDDPTVIEDIFVPFNRGIPSDYDIISKEDYKYLTGWEGMITKRLWRED